MNVIILFIYNFYKKITNSKAFYRPNKTLINFAVKLLRLKLKIL